MNTDPYKKKRRKPSNKGFLIEIVDNLKKVIKTSSVKTSTVMLGKKKGKKKEKKKEKTNPY